VDGESVIVESLWDMLCNCRHGIEIWSWLNYKR
jgi:hypothetical protein